MPVSVPRTWRGEQGALTWWVDDVRFDEQTRLVSRTWPPDLDAWGRQMERMWIFTELVHDPDRHGGNLLYTNDWTLQMIDFTRAFGLDDALLKPYRLVRLDAGLQDALRALTRDQLDESLGAYLTAAQRAAILARRDHILAHFDTPPPD